MNIIRIVKHSVLSSILLIGVATAAFCQELPCKAYYPENDGGRCKERYKEDGNGEVHGIYISYSMDGAVEIRGSYVHGIKQGSWYYASFYLFAFYHWYENGEIIAKSAENPINSKEEALALKKTAQLEYEKRVREEEEKSKEEERKSQEEAERKSNHLFDLYLNENFYSWDDQKNVELQINTLHSLAYSYPLHPRVEEAKLLYNKLKIRLQTERLKKEEQEKPDHTAFNEAKSSFNFNEYLNKFPNGLHVKEAKEAKEQNDKMATRVIHALPSIAHVETGIFENGFNSGFEYGLRYYSQEGTIRLGNSHFNLLEPQFAWVKDTIFHSLFERLERENRYLEIVRYYRAALGVGCSQSVLDKYSWANGFLRAFDILDSKDLDQKEKYMKSKTILGESVKFNNYFSNFFLGITYLLLEEKSTAQVYIGHLYGKARVSKSEYYPVPYEEANKLLNYLRNRYGIKAEQLSSIMERDQRGYLVMTPKSIRKFVD